MNSESPRADALRARLLALPAPDLSADLAEPPAYFAGYEDARRHALAEAADVAEQEVAQLERRLAEAEAARGWVSVEERLPPPGYGVICWKGDCYAIGIYDAVLGWLHLGYDDPFEGVTHWRPYPAPPTDIGLAADPGDAREGE